MKHKREIKIKNPHLRVIRNNLREILYLHWCTREDAIIDAQMDVLNSTGLSKEEMLKIHRELEIKLIENRKIIKFSIIMCAWCHQRNKDVVYDSLDNKWFCPDCFYKYIIYNTN